MFMILSFLGPFHFLKHIRSYEIATDSALRAVAEGEKCCSEEKDDKNKTKNTHLAILSNCGYGQ